MTENKNQLNVKTSSPKVSDQITTIVVFGASGDLAKKKTFPALFGLLRHQYLPKHVQVIGYARTEMDVKDFRQKVTEKIKLKQGEEHLLEAFKQKLFYISGSYNDAKAFEPLKKKILEAEQQSQKEGGKQPALRILYLALPPPMFEPVCENIKKVLYDNQIQLRVIVEKPFGKDLQSSNELSNQISSLLKEDEIYRIDHYLGKEMVKNIMVIRFANVFFNGVWNRHYINNIQITFKEPFGTEGRGGYFDEYGIIRDVIQNHLLQVLSIIAMERPVSLGAEDVRDEKVKVLKLIEPLKLENLLIGQYTKSEDGKKPGYKDDDTVPKDSNTPTYAAAVLFINNDRWYNVPFILKAGKALDEQKMEVRIQFDDVPGAIFPNLSRNELVIRVQPNEAVYMKMMNKKPGLENQTLISELDLSYKTRYSDVYIPDAYEALLLDVLNGEGSNFVRSDELEASWKIFTPILHKIDQEKIQPELYAYGSRGPSKANDFVAQYGFVRHQQEYIWSPANL